MNYKMTQEQYDKINEVFKVLIEKQKELFNLIDNICIDDVTDEQENKYYEVREKFWNQAYKTYLELIDIRYQEGLEESIQINEYIEILEKCNSYEGWLDDIHKYIKENTHMMHNIIKFKSWAEDMYNDIIGNSVIIEEETKEIEEKE